MQKNILLIGGGGHCKSVLDSILQLNEYLKIGIIDKKDKIDSSVMGIPVVGCDQNLKNLFHNGYKYAFITLGSIGDSSIRKKLYDKLIKIGFKIPIIIDPSASVSKSAMIESGVFIGKQSIVNSDSIIRKCSIINSGSIVEHDCQIGDFVHIAPGAVLGGNVHIGENSHIGLNASIKQQVKIGANTMIGMGSIVLNDIDDNIIAYGNPCREAK